MAEFNSLHFKVQEELMTKDFDPTKIEVTVKIEGEDHTMKLTELAANFAEVTLGGKYKKVTQSQIRNFTRMNNAYVNGFFLGICCARIEKGETV